MKIQFIKKTILVLCYITAAGCQQTDYEQMRDEPQSQRAAEAILTGSLTYLVRIALTPNASAHVRLIDAKGNLIAEQAINPAGQVPIPFKLHYSAGAQQPYQLEAEIREQGQRRFSAVQPIIPERLAEPLIVRLNLVAP